MWTVMRSLADGDGLSFASGFDQHGSPVVALVREGQIDAQVFSDDQALILAKQIEMAVIDMRRIREPGGIGSG